MQSKISREVHYSLRDVALMFFRTYIPPGSVIVGDTASLTSLLSLVSLETWLSPPWSFEGFIDRALDDIKSEENYTFHGSQTIGSNDSYVVLLGGRVAPPGDRKVDEKLAQDLSRIIRAHRRTKTRWNGNRGVRVAILMTWTNEDAASYEESGALRNALPYAQTKHVMEKELTEALAHWDVGDDKVDNTEGRQNGVEHIDVSVWVYYAPFLAGVSALPTQGIYGFLADYLYWDTCIAFPSDGLALQLNLKHVSLLKSDMLTQNMVP